MLRDMYHRLVEERGKLQKNFRKMEKVEINKEIFEKLVNFQSTQCK